MMSERAIMSLELNSRLVSSTDVEASDKVVLIIGYRRVVPASSGSFMPVILILTFVASSIRFGDTCMEMFQVFVRFPPWRPVRWLYSVATMPEMPNSGVATGLLILVKSMWLPPGKVK